MESPVKRMMRQTTEWEKIFANTTSNRIVVEVFRIYEDLSKFNSRKSKQSTQNMGKRLEGIFHRRR